MIVDIRAHAIRDDFSQLILEALLLHVGKRHVSGIGTDVQSVELFALVRSLCGSTDRNMLSGRQLFVGLV